MKNVRSTRLRISERDREVMYEMLSSGKEIRDIAKRLKRHESVISRDLKRNGGNSPWWDSLSPMGKGREAHKRATQRLKRSRKKQRLKHWRIRRVVRSLIIERRWGPEQIAGYFKKFHPGLYVCAEAIYQWIAADAPELKQYLVCGGKKYRKNRVKPKRDKKKAAAPKTNISERPESVVSREEFGHFEGDAVVSKRNTVSIINIVERLSRYIYLEKVPDCSGESGKTAFIKALSQIPAHLRKSLTLDNGPENSLHPQIEEELKLKIYFCNAYHPFEKGTVENRNKFFRIFHPKGTDLSLVALHELQRIADLHNNRPMKCLGFRTPKQVFNQALRENKSATIV